MEREQGSHSALYIEQVDENPSIANNQYVVEKKKKNSFVRVLVPVHHSVPALLNA
jgi:hypothetical protein